MILHARRYFIIIPAILLMFIAQVFCLAADLSDELIKWQKENNWSADVSSNIGHSRYGFTRYKSDGGNPRMNGWCKPLDSGEVRYWNKSECDKNGNGVMDGDEIVKLKYWFWYPAKVSVNFAWERTYKSGAEWLENEAQRLINAEKVAIGDGGYVGIDGYTKQIKCCAYKGPLYISAEIQLAFDIVSSLYFSSNTQWFIPYTDVIEKDALTAKHDAYIKNANQVLKQLVSDIIAGSPAGKTSATEKPAAKPATKPTAQQPKGTPGLTLTATPEALWADGKSGSKLKLVACDANGNPIKGSFDIDVASGKCSHVKFLTDATGTATATYTAPVEPGEDTITVVGPDGQKASVTIRLGGLKLIPEDGNRPALFADGKTKMDMIVIGGDPNFNPLAGTKVKLFANEKELPVKGSLSDQSVIIGPDGTAKFTYSSPDVYSVKSDFRRGDVYVAAIASLGNPAREVRADYRIHIYSGEVYFLSVEKTGFQPLEKFVIPAPSMNGVLSGIVIHEASDKSFPISNARLTLTNTQDKPVGIGVSDKNGKFQFEFVGDIMNSTGQEMEMNEPIKLALDEDIVHLMTAWKEDMDILEKAKYDVNSMKKFADDLPKNLAASSMDSTKPLSSTEYLVYSTAKLAWTCRYIKLLDQRQLESADWFLDSAKNVLSTVADFAGVSDKIEATAKGKLKNRFRPETWKKFEDNMLREFLSLFYKQFQKGIDVAKTLNYDTGDLEPLQKFGANYATTKGINEIGIAMKSSFEDAVRKSSQKILSQAGTKASRGELSSEPPSEVLFAAKEMFTEYEKKHNTLNIENLDRELYRLDAKLFVDTVIKGPFIYFNLKKLVLEPDTLQKISELDTETFEKLQEELIGSGDTVSKIFSAFDLMFQGYQGYNWLVDYCNAGTVKAKIAKSLTD